METIQHTGAFLRRRKMMMVLPLIMLPFITMIWWALGPGKTTSKINELLSRANGLNPQLPAANIRADEGIDKLRFYEIAANDSAQLRQRERSDQFFSLPPAVDTQEIIIHQKLAAINAALEKTPATHATTPFENKITGDRDVNTDRIEKMMQQIKPAVEQHNDTELSQINSMLEKVMDIQHPERLADKYKAAGAPVQPPISVRSNNNINPGFYISADADTGNNVSNTIAAGVYETQTLVNGSTVKLRLLDEIMAGGIAVPANSFIYGTATLAGERLTVIITCIRYGQGLIPVSLGVYDMDGMSGIWIPGAITRDVARQSADNALQSVALNTLDPSIGAQAAGAGVETAKNLLSKKVKLVRVTVKAGYRVLLKDNNTP